MIAYRATLDVPRELVQFTAKLKEPAIPGVGLGIGVSPDGHWLLYSQTDAEQSEIMLAPES